jgi:hypothetical protein
MMSVHNFFVMERLYQGHLHPLLEQPVSAGKRTRASAVGGERSSQELFEQHLIAIRNIYMSTRHGFVLHEHK